MVSPPMLPALRFLDVPLVPDADEARRWAAEELANQVYQDAKPGLLGQVLDLLGRALREFLAGLGTADGNIGLAIVVGLVVVAVLAIVLIVRPRLNRKKAADKSVFATDAVLTAAQHRKLAKAAAQVGNWTDAINEQFRAIARDGEERDITARTPGRTAAEISAELVVAFPTLDRALHSAAETFNAVRYGKVPATEAMYNELTATDAAVAKTSPVYADDFAAVPQ